MKKKIYLITLSIVTIICVIAGLCFHTVRFGLSFFDQLHLPFFSEEPDSDDDLEKMTASDVGDIDWEDSRFISLNVTNDVGKTIISSPDDLSGYYMDLQSDIGDVTVSFP